MNHQEVVEALCGLFPAAEWSYDGDGSTLDATYDEDGKLESRGLEWHAATPRPTLKELAAWIQPPPVPPVGSIVTLEDGSSAIVTATDPLTGGVSVSPLQAVVAAEAGRLTVAE